MSSKIAGWGTPFSVNGGRQSFRIRPQSTGWSGEGKGKTMVWVDVQWVEQQVYCRIFEDSKENKRFQRVNNDNSK